MAGVARREEILEGVRPAGTKGRARSGTDPHGRPRRSPRPRPRGRRPGRSRAAPRARTRAGPRSRAPRDRPLRLRGRGPARASGSTSRVYWIVVSGSKARVTLRAASVKTRARSGLRKDVSDRRSPSAPSGIGRARVWMGVRSIVIAAPLPGRAPSGTTPPRTPPTTFPARSGFFQTPRSKRVSASVLRRRTPPTSSGASLVIRSMTRSLLLSVPKISGSTLSEKPVVISRPASAPRTTGALRRGRKRKSGIARTIAAATEDTSGPKPGSARAARSRSHSSGTAARSRQSAHLTRTAHATPAMRTT